MSWLEIMWIIGAIILIALLIVAYFEWKAKDRNRSEAMTIMTFFMIFVVAVCLAVNFTAYNDAVFISYEYRALISDVDDMEEYLMRYENISDEGFGSIGQGLESLEYKQELQKAIRDRNEKKADICGLLNNYWTPYKNLIIRGLPPGDYGYVTISDDGDVRILNYE